MTADAGPDRPGQPKTDGAGTGSRQAYQSSPMQVERDGVEYTIRWYEPGDGEGFCSLLAAVTGAERDVEWFERLYVEAPYLDHVPLVVATAGSDDRVVGTRPFVAFRVRAGGETELALLTRDTMVHPDHRRRGLFTTMTEVALDRYEAGEPAFVFSHSNANSRPGYRKMGWRFFGGRTRHYRVQDPGALVDARCRDWISRLLGPAAAPLGRGYLRARDLVASPPSGIEVTAHSTPPIETLATLAERGRPGAIHPVRDRAYYRWLFDRPAAETARTYVASHDDEPVAAAVAHRSLGRGGFDVAQVSEVVPTTGGRQWGDGLAAVLDRVIADEGGADVVRVAGSTLPASILHSRGFLPNDRLPLSPLSYRPLRLGIRPLTGADDWRVNGQPLAEAAPHLWSLA